MNPIERKNLFPQIDPEKESYFEEAGQAPMLLSCHFNTLPELKKMLEDRLGDRLTSQEILEISKTTFRCKPETVRGGNPVPGDRNIVDFIYEM